ncbi:MAG: hypothetical protein H0W34_12940 [Pyrinomonadaceae bacterium]|nr:hypothetical protein [Pyrinomonadaceae bacterium]
MNGDFKGDLAPIAKLYGGRPLRLLCCVGCTPWLGTVSTLRPGAHMIKHLRSACFAPLLAVMSGCGVIGDVFKTGMWTGIIITVAIIALIVFVISKSRSK